ncbi:MAG: Glycosyl transferase, WecB/TagA/CpsF family [uncultured bacterium]|nr:MAG: Glycosyl transferase, WecB/TagA/CpsF family [uncultured bacterium]HBD05600.1 glycosyltransferase [Candidatus Uhrbacteria bacterium]
MDTIKICGIIISNISRAMLRDFILQYLNSNNQHFIVTPNPEMIVASRNKQDFSSVLNNADLSIPDGVGLMIASRFVKNGPLKERITGNDLVSELSQIAFAQGKRILLLGGGKGVAEKAAEALRKNFQGIEVIGIAGGRFNPITGEFESNTEVVQQINNFKPSILTVSLGHEKQEQWIHNNLSKLPSVKIAAGVGGAIDFMAGTVPRAPILMQRAGIEWLWRLWREPKRYKRIFDAVCVFPLIFIKCKLYD